MKVCLFFVAHPQWSKLIQPGERPLDQPAPLPQSAAMFGVAPRKKRDDPSFTQTLPDRFGIITKVGKQAVGTMAVVRALPIEMGWYQQARGPACESLRLAHVRLDWLARCGLARRGQIDWSGCRGPLLGHYHRFSVPVISRRSLRLPSGISTATQGVSPDTTSVCQISG